MKNAMKVIMGSLVLLTSLILLVSCGDDGDDSDVLNSITKYDTPKYVFYFIGDGMANPQVNLTEAALNDDDFRLAKPGDVGVGVLNLSTFPVIGMATTFAEDRYITGSAAAATALACGKKTTIGTISQNGDHSQDFETMAEMAKAKGMKIGIISSVSIDHATPACFYAHEPSRGNYNNIAAQMATSNFDYFAGGFAKGDFEKYRGRDPEGDPKDIIAEMQNAGYTITTTRAELQATQPGQKVWAYTGYDGDAALYYELDRPSDHVSLAEFTAKGIELLHSKDGFFMMIEGGKIDWACHANDAVSAAHDLIAFDNAIGEALDFYNEHPKETLIIITGDHECGGLTLGFAATEYESAFALLKDQKISYQEFAVRVGNWADNGNVNFSTALDSMKYFFGLGNANLNNALALSEYETNCLKEAFNESMSGDTDRDNEENFLKYGPYYDPFTITITHILNQKAGIDWTSYYHTGVPVPVYAMGQGQYEFSGSYDNTDIAKKIIEIAELASD